MLRIEFHCHTCYSKDSRVKLETLLSVCREKGIDRVVITDHNNIQGALLAKEMDPQRVIIGEEIFTTRGELLASYMTQEIPRGLEPKEAISRLRSQGAFISVSHPFDTYRSGGWDLPDLEEIAPLVDAVEVFNSRCLNPEFNRNAARFALDRHLGGTVGSDCHTKVEIGMSTLLLPDFSNADELRSVIHQGQMDVRLSPWWVHFISNYVKWNKRVEKRLHPVKS
jgi:predicted metal-dependent phosphoesterase TrpH